MGKGLAYAFTIHLAFCLVYLPFVFELFGVMRVLNNLPFYLSYHETMCIVFVNWKCV